MSILNIINWQSLSADEQGKILKRPKISIKNDLSLKVKSIIGQVRETGDKACINLTNLFDKVNLDKLEVSNDELDEAKNKVDETTLQAIKKVMNRLYAFHLPQKLRDYQVEITPGIRCESLARPLQRIGLYIPGGTAPLVSTVLMLGIPAQIAGCPSRILCTPPDRNGKIHPAILVAAQLAGINEVYKIGGAQAIAAMAYGTESMARVDKIFGPGNRYVTEAKIQVSLDASGAACDCIAGPSEVMVIADENANPDYIAADLLSQAEHGEDSQVIFVTTDIKLASKVNQAIDAQLTVLSRYDIAEKSLKNSRCIFADSVDEAIDIANLYAPEHLILQVEKPRQYINRIVSAGSVFLGAFSPESAGDYASGTNHVLPTSGFAKSMSGLSVRDFMKSISVQELTQDGLLEIADCIRVLANIEGLDAHRNAVDIRLGNKKLDCFRPGPHNDGQQILARPDILVMTAYRSARSENKSGSIWLDANENPFNGMHYNRYPEPQPAALLALFARLYETSPEKILVTRGSDEGIDLLVRLFCEAGKDNVMICPPTYGMYKIAATIQGVNTLEVPLCRENDFSLDLPAMMNAITANTKIIFLCSPNNPTGNLLDAESILALCTQLKNKCLVVVDEAYIEFSGASSMANYLDEYDNLVVLRTLSKAYGLAGMRCGVTLANTGIINLLKKIIAPYPLPSPITEAIGRELMDINIHHQVSTIQTERNTLFQYLKQSSFVQAIWKSDANFILFESTAAKKILSLCLEHGIVIRDRSQEHGLMNCLRISIGTADENTYLREVLDRV